MKTEKFILFSINLKILILNIQSYLIVYSVSLIEKYYTLLKQSKLSN